MDNYEFNIKIPKSWVRQIVRNYGIIAFFYLLTFLLFTGFDLRVIFGVALAFGIGAILSFLQWRFYWVLMWIGSYLVLIYAAFAFLMLVLNRIF